jgi:hypothetical protein
VIDEYYARGSLIYILWGLALLCMGLFLIFGIFAKRDGIRVTIGCTSFIYILFVCLGGLFMLLTMFLADYCEAPSYNSVRFLPSSSSSNSDVQNTAIYYTSCNSAYANATLETDLQEGTYYVNLFADNIDTATSTLCTSDVNLEAMKATVLSINASLNQIYHQVDCETSLLPIWQSIVNEGICGDFYLGVFYLWSGFMLTSFFMFLTMMVSTITYQFYLPAQELNGYMDLPDERSPMDANAANAHAHAHANVNRDDEEDGSIGDELEHGGRVAAGAMNGNGNGSRHGYVPVENRQVEMVSTGQIHLVLGGGAGGAGGAGGGDEGDLDPRYVNPHPPVTAQPAPSMSHHHQYSQLNTADPAQAKIRAYQQQQQQQQQR